MAITKVGNSKVARGTFGDLVVNIPTGTQIGDVVIFEVLVAAASSVPATPLGLTLIDSGATTWSYATYYKVWDGTEGSITFTFANAGGCVMTRTYRGVDIVNPIHKHSINRTATNNSPVATGVTTTVPGCMLIYSAGTGSTVASSFTNPTNFVAQDIYSIAGSGSSIGCDLLQAAAGATGNETGTWVGLSSPTSYASLIALTPATSVWTPLSGVQGNTPGSYSWVCPSGVFGIDVEGWGAGGGSAGGFATDNYGGSAGGGGEFRKYVGMPVIPGRTYRILVGLAGVAGGASAGRGRTGMGSAFIDDVTGTVKLWAKGGVGGIGDGGAGGAGGDSGVGGSIHYKGGNGQTATSTAGTTGGGCGGPTGAGADGPPGTAGTGGNTGAGGGVNTAGGTPGGGAGGPVSTGSPAGKAGGPGAIRLTVPEIYPRVSQLQLM